MNRTEAVVGANLKGGLILQRPTHLIARRQQGNIVNIAFLPGLTALNRVGQRQFQARVIHATKVLALELAANNIHLNALAPAISRPR